MKKIALCGLIALGGMMGLTACDEEANITFAQWKGFTIDNNSVAPGDTLVVRAKVDKGGKNLFGVKYDWTMTVDTVSADGTQQGQKKLNYTIASKSSRPIHMNTEPVAYFRIPESTVLGTFNTSFSFEANYKNAAYSKAPTFTTNVQEGFYGKTITYTGLTELYSRAKAEFAAPVTIKSAE